jgi:hypothetical protein
VNSLFGGFAENAVFTGIRRGQGNTKTTSAANDSGGNADMDQFIVYP